MGKVQLVARDSKGQVMWVRGDTSQSILTHWEWREAKDMTTGTVTSSCGRVFHPPFTLRGEEKTEMKDYKIGVIWLMGGYLNVQAENLSDAVKIADDMCMGDVKNPEYVEASWELEEEIAEEEYDEEIIR